MKKLLAAKNPKPALEYLKLCRVGEYIFGSNEFEYSNISPQNIWLRLALLIGSNPKLSPEFIINRWKLSNKEAALLAFLVENNISKTNLSDEWQLKKLIRKHGNEKAALLLQKAEATQQSEIDFTNYINLASGWKKPFFPLTGKDLQAIGIKSGKEMGDILKKLENNMGKLTLQIIS